MRTYTLPIHLPLIYPSYNSQIDCWTIWLHLKEDELIKPILGDYLNSNRVISSNNYLKHLFACFCMAEPNELITSIKSDVGSSDCKYSAPCIGFELIELINSNSKPYSADVAESLSNKIYGLIQYKLSNLTYLPTFMASTFTCEMYEEMYRLTTGDERMPAYKSNIATILWALLAEDMLHEVYSSLEDNTFPSSKSLLKYLSYDKKGNIKKEKFHNVTMRTTFQIALDLLKLFRVIVADVTKVC